MSDEPSVQVLLDCILERLFTAKSFEPEHVLVSKFDGDAPLCTPDATQRDQLLAWVEGLKSQQVRGALSDFLAVVLKSV